MFGHALVADVSEYIRFFAVEQRTGLRHVIDVCGDADHGVNQTLVGVHAYMRLHAKVPLVPLLGRTGRSYQGGVHHRTLFEHQAFVGQGGVDHCQYLRGQLVFFEQVAKAQDADPVGDALDICEASKLVVQRGLEQGFLHGQVTQTEPLLEEMNAQHRHQLKRRASGLGPQCGRLNQRKQHRQRHHHRFISSRNTALRVRRVLKFRPRSCWVMTDAPRSRHSGLAGVLNTITRLWQA